MKLSIPDPCSQKWEQMAVVDQESRFCSECTRDIIDFSNHTDEQILKYVWKNPIRLCGRFSQNQLNRAIGKDEFDFPGLKALLIAGTLTSVTNNVGAQISVNKIETHQITEVESNYQVIRGKILGTISPQTYRQLKLEIPQLNLYCYSDSEGNFQFSVPKNQLPDSIDLIIRKGNSYKEFKNLNPKEFIQHDASLYPIEIDTNFVHETQMIGYVVVKPKWYQFGYKIRRLWYRIFY